MLSQLYNLKDVSSANPSHFYQGGIKERNVSHGKKLSEAGGKMAGWVNVLWELPVSTKYINSSPLLIAGPPAIEVSAPTGAGRSGAACGRLWMPCVQPSVALALTKAPFFCSSLSLLEVKMKGKRDRKTMLKRWRRLTSKERNLRPSFRYAFKSQLGKLPALGF